MYSVAKALYHSVTITYEMYTVNTLGSVYFYISWSFWLVVIISGFAVIPVLLIGLIELERKIYITKKYHTYLAMKIIQNDDKP